MGGNDGAALVGQVGSKLPVSPPRQALGKGKERSLLAGGEAAGCRQTSGGASCAEDPCMIWCCSYFVRATLSDPFLQGVATCLTPKGGSDSWVVTVIFQINFRCKPSFRESGSRNVREVSAQGSLGARRPQVS